MKNINYVLIFLLLFGAVSVNFSCRSYAKRLDTDKDLIADTGELTRYELEKSAIKLSQDIHQNFVERPREEGVFLAFLPMKNETSESIATKVFDNTMTQELRKQGVFIISVKNRKEALKEFQFSQTGLTENTLSVGRLKSPNFFLESRIDENIFRHRGDKIVEQVINIELIEVETLIVEYSNKVIYRKKAATSSKVDW